MEFTLTILGLLWLTMIISAIFCRNKFDAENLWIAWMIITLFSMVFLMLYIGYDLVG